MSTPEPFSTEAEALATAIYEDNVNSWFEAKRMLVAALQSAYERGKKDARDATLEEAAALIGANIIKQGGAGEKFLARRGEGNQDGLYYAAAIRAMKQEAGE